MKSSQRWCETPFQHIVFTLCTSKRQIKKTGFEPTDSKSDANVTFYTNGVGCAAIVLIKKNNRSDIENYALLTHEAVHIWQEVKILMGESAPSPEFEAYSVQQIALELFSLWREKNDMEKPTD